MTDPVMRAQYRCSLGLSSPKSCSRGFCGATDCATPFVSSGNADLSWSYVISSPDIAGCPSTALRTEAVCWGDQPLQGDLMSCSSIFVIFFRQTPNRVHAA